MSITYSPEMLPKCEDGDGKVYIARAGCTACGGSGYVLAFQWRSTGTGDSDNPPIPNTLVPCSCLERLERLNRAFRHGC